MLFMLNYGGSPLAGALQRRLKGSRMNFCRRPISLLLLCIALSLSASAQITEILQSPNGTSKEKAAPVDPLGRQTPNGTLFGFLRRCRMAIT